MSNNSIYSVFDIVVIDEYYNIGKHDSTLYKALRAMAARAIVVGLSRTPIDVGIARVVPLMLVNQATVFSLQKKGYKVVNGIENDLVTAFGEFALNTFYPKARAL